jgi:methyl-accepting chemotaxis protein WspA
MPKHLSIKNKLTLGLGAMVAIILSLLTLALNNFRAMANADDWNRHTLEVLLEADHVGTSVLQVQSSARGYLLTGDTDLVAPITAEYRNAQDHLVRDKVDILLATVSKAASGEAVHELQYAAGELQSSVANFSVSA